MPLTDPEIEEIVRANLDRDQRLSNPRTIGAVVGDGTVTVTGTVPNDAQRIAAIEDAWNAPGVRDVIDELTVIPVVTRDDDALTTDVRDALSHDPALDADQIFVAVLNGTVYLDGTVPTHEQIGRAADVAGQVAGVLNVVNRLTTPRQ